MPKQEVVFSNFSGGQDIRQWPPSYVRERVAEGKLPHILGCQVESDGTLRWYRNQYMIDGPGGVTPTALFEYTTSTSEQLLMFGTDGKLHSLETDWSAATPAQDAYGYELFNGGSWTERATGQQAAGPWGLVQHRERIFVAHRSQATKYYEGTTALADVGLPTPTVPPSTSVQQDLSTFDETDGGGYLTLAANKITATAMPVNADGTGAIASNDYTADYFGTSTMISFDFRFTVFDIHADPTVTLLHLGNEDPQAPTEPTDMNTDGCFVNAWADAGGIILEIETFFGTKDSESESDATRADDMYDFQLNTTYYAVVHRYSQGFWLSVYANADYTTLLYWDVLSAKADPYRYLMLMSAYGDAGAEDVSGYIENVDIWEDTLTAGQLPVGTYSYVYTFGNDDPGFESMPSDIFTMHVTTADKEINLTNISIGPTGTTWRRIYRAYSIDATIEEAPGPFLLLTKLDDNTATTFADNVPAVYLGDAITFDHARPPKGDILVSHKDHLFMAGVSETSDSYATTSTIDLQNLLYYSRLDDPWHWPGANYIQVGDDSPIVGLVSWQDYLIIVKTNSTWLLAGAEGSFVLRQIDSQVGATDPCSIVSSPQGLAWTAPSGVAFYDGQSLRMLYDADDISPHGMPTSDYPWLAWHQGYLYFMPSGTTGSRLLRWNSLRDAWEMHPHTKAADIVGLRSFNYGQYQSHLLGYVDANTATQKIMVLHPAKAFANGGTEGTSYSDYYAPIKITLPPITAEPGEEIWIQEIRIDGSWDTVGAIGAKDYSGEVLHLFVNTSADYSTGDLGAALQGGLGVKLPPSFVDVRQWIQLSGDYAENFELRRVNVVVSSRKKVLE